MITFSPSLSPPASLSPPPLSPPPPPSSPPPPSPNSSPDDPEVLYVRQLAMVGFESAPLFSETKSVLAGGSSKILCHMTQLLSKLRFIAMEKLTGY